MRTSLALLLTASLSLVRGIEPLPKTPEFSGYFSPSLVHMSFRDHMVAGSGSLDVGNARVDSLDSKASREDAANLSLSGELGYKFAERSLYVFIGNHLDDFLRLDNSFALGARFQTGGVEIWEVSALFSGAPTQVWEDPYLIGADREETDRTGAGARVGVANIAGSGVEVMLTVREIKVDNEHSGEGLGLDAAARRLLRRDGETVRLEILRSFKLGEHQSLIPALNFGMYDADGEALSREGYGIHLTHVWQIGRLRLLSNLTLSRSEFDEANPVFGMKQDEETVMLSLTGIYPGIFGKKQLSGMAGLLYAERDSDIDFHDSEATVFNLGIMYMF